MVDVVAKGSVEFLIEIARDVGTISTHILGVSVKIHIWTEVEFFLFGTLQGFGYL